MKRRLEGVRMSIPTNSHGLLIFKRTARPVGIPPELLALPRDSQMEYDNNLGSISGSVVCPASEYLEELKSTIEQQAKGYFTIDEAAQILTVAHGADAKRWRAELWREIRAEKLKVLDEVIHRPVFDLDAVRDFRHHLRASDIVAAGIAFPIQWPALPVTDEVMPCDVQANAEPGLLLKRPLEGVKMFVPSMLNMADVMADSGYTEEAVFDCGISGQIVFLVVVPLVGACRVPVDALSHFMAGADDYTAEGMPEHWSGALSDKWTIKRDRLRILESSWNVFSDNCDELAEAWAAASQPTTPTPAMLQSTETKEQREDRRLQDCETYGLVMPKSYLSRLPDGVGDVAEREGVTRQAFSVGVRAALKRRESVIRAGGLSGHN